MLARSFSSFIATGQLLTRHKVQKVCRTDNHLKQYLKTISTAKKICIFVCYHTNSVRASQFTMESDLLNRNSTISSSQASSCQPWLSSHTQAVEERFVNIPHMPSKQAVLNKFCQDDVLQHILAVKGEVRCYEIVKNYFRRRQASLMLLISPTLYVNIHQSIYLFIYLYRDFYIELYIFL